MDTIEILTLIAVIIALVGLVISALSLGFSIGKNKKEHHR